MDEKGPSVAKGLADINANRTHFIFELLQNAEDAITRRGPLNGMGREQSRFI